MRLTWLPIFILLLFTGAKNPPPDSPSGLMVEFIREPGEIKILDLNPEFSWIVPQNAESQKAYQILIASTREQLEKNKGDIWDSKRINRSISSEVAYNGNTLSQNTLYFWKVRIWNSKNLPTGYSYIQSFTTGNPSSYSTTQNKFQSNLIDPEKIIKLSDDSYFIDFGKDAFGTLILKLEPTVNDTVIIHLGEKLSGFDQIDRKPGGTIRYLKILLPIEPGKKSYILDLPKDTRNTGPAAVQLPDSVGVIAPFRYCELENFHFDLESAFIRQKTYNYYFDDSMSSFASSDTILNKIWDICKYSIKATSFAGLYIDGDRERIPYEADAYINQLGHYYTDREYSLARLTNEYFIEHPSWPTEWILQTVPMFYNDYMYTGNPESVKKYWEELKYKTLSLLARKDGLISSTYCSNDIMKKLGFSNANERIRDIVDWPPSQRDTDWKLATEAGERDGYEMVKINTVVNAFYYHGLKLISELAGVIGKKEDSVYYQNLASGVKISFNDKFLDKTSKIYVDGESSKHSSLHANMMALAFGLVPEEYKKMVLEFIKSRGMACSVYGAQYLLEALYNEEEEDYAFSLLTDESDRSWWNMIKTGSTITMEAWDMKYKPNSDWNHAWGAAPANIIPRFLWGIGPSEPGYAKAIIKPQLSTLKHSKISVPTIRGYISAEYTNKGKSKEYTITIPANMFCDFILPDTDRFSVFLNNKKTAVGAASLKLKPGLNRIIIKN
jgi:alpha-L-rhamnosidase